jgi:hypothetical protein
MSMGNLKVRYHQNFGDKFFIKSRGCSFGKTQPQESPDDSCSIWCACGTPSQTLTNNSNRSRVFSRF